jgi:hypothetical protein
MNTEKPRAVKGSGKCPLWKKDMSQVCHTCALWTHVRGKDPQSETTVDRWGCSFTWLPALLIENSQMQWQTGAAVESARNEQVKSAHLIADSVGQAVDAFQENARNERELMTAALKGVVTTLIGTTQQPRQLT